MRIRQNRVKDASVYIFVQTHLQREGLPAIKYINAEQRTEETVKLYRDLFKIPSDRIHVLENRSKAEILAIFNKLKKDSD